MLERSRETVTAGRPERTAAHHSEGSILTVAASLPAYFERVAYISTLAVDSPRLPMLAGLASSDHPAHSSMSTRDSG